MGVDQAIDITPEQRALVIALLNKHLPRTTAWVYGSRANWTSRPESDLDLVVFLAPKQAHAVSNLREAFEESDLPFKVDLFVWDEVPKAFHEAIKRDHVVLTEVKHRVGDQIETTYGIFSADFQESRLKDICAEGDGIQTGPFGSQLHKRDYVETGTPIITVEHLGCNRIIHDKDVPRVSEQDKRRLYKYSLRVGDIVFSRVGSVDRRALVRDGEEGWLFSGRCLRVRPDISKIHPKYLSYFFGLPSFREHIRTIAVGATMPSLNTRILADAEVVHPTRLSEQRSIAHILGALDDKIELNRRMNKTLEAMTRSIFRDWFVDFGPTRAKTEGHTPYLTPKLWNFFPDTFDKDDVPNGWKLSELGKEVEVVGGSTPSTKVPTFWTNGRHHWATPKDLSKLDSPVLLNTDRKITDSGLASISSGLLPIGTVLLSSRAPIGYLAVTEIPVAVNQGFIAMVCEKKLSNLFVLYWCYENLDYIKSISGGSTFSEISKRVFRPVPIVVPSDQVLTAYDTVAYPLFHRIATNMRESELLAQTRDLLLPKLISGEIRLSQAEKIVEEAI